MGCIPSKPAYEKTKQQTLEQNTQSLKKDSKNPKIKTINNCETTCPLPSR